MSAASSGSRAIFFVGVLCFVGSGPAQSQSTSSPEFNVFKPGGRTSSEVWLAKCAAPSMHTFARRLFSDGGEWPAVPDGMPTDRNVAVPDSFCMSPTPSDAPRPTAPFDAHCPEGSATVPGAQPPFGCHVPGDTVLDELVSLGKPGVKIERAREEVLKILRSESTCTEWFQSKDRKPAETFQSLDFSLDAHGPHDIFAFMQEPSVIVLRQPYVARATQDGGAYTTITINAHGAFYRPQGQVQNTTKEGGPTLRGGTHLLTVGSFRGDTLPAQMVTLLHEFGHIIDLLPEDADDLDGKSVRNTNEVLLHCRGEIEARALEAKHK